MARNDDLLCFACEDGKDRVSLASTYRIHSGWLAGRCFSHLTACLPFNTTLLYTLDPLLPARCMRRHANSKAGPMRGRWVAHTRTGCLLGLLCSMLVWMALRAFYLFYLMLFLPPPLPPRASSPRLERRATAHADDPSLPPNSQIQQECKILSMQISQSTHVG